MLATPVFCPVPQPEVHNRYDQERFRIKEESITQIIIIPAASTSLITMYNAKDILQDLRFISTDEKKNQGFKRENEVLIQRTKDSGLSVPYRVIDNPQKLLDEEMTNVVAVFTDGEEMEFQEWPGNGNPVEIFTRIKPFHLKWEDVPLNVNVAKWDAHVIQLSKSNRNLDEANLLKFWKILDSFYGETQT